MTVSAVNPWRMAFREARCFPFSLFGSVLFVAFAEVGLGLSEGGHVGRRRIWLRFVILPPVFFAEIGASVSIVTAGVGVTTSGWWARPGPERVGFDPKLARDASGVHAGILPPIGLNPAAGLREAQMMGIAGLTSADQAGLFGDKSQVYFIAQATRLRNGEQALIDSVGYDLLASLRFLLALRQNRMTRHR